MKIIIAGSGAVGLTTAHELIKNNHKIQIISSQTMGSPHPSTTIPLELEKSLHWIPAERIDQETTSADVIFCCGSEAMLKRLEHKLDQKIEAPIFFLTSWSRALAELQKNRSRQHLKIVPCYPAFACEKDQNKLIRAGRYQLEVATDWLPPFQLQSISMILDRLGLQYSCRLMEMRFKAHWSRTQFAYWYLSQGYHQRPVVDQHDLQEMQKKWQVMDDACQEFKDLQIPLELFIYSLKLGANSADKNNGLGFIISKLLTTERYKINAFLS